MKRSILFTLYTILCICSAAAQSGYGTGGDFTPDNPAIPGANGLYLEQHTVVLDGLRVVDNDIIGDAVYSLWHRYCQEHNIAERDAYVREEKYMEVMSRVYNVLICGDLSEQEYDGFDASQVGVYFPSMTTLDLSRTYGWRGFGVGYEEEGVQHLQTIILPDCVEEVTTLMALHSLTDVYCYAELPPVMEQESQWYKDELFADDAEVTVHVPSSSVNLYKASETWGKYAIVGFEENVSKIEVKMPQGVDVGQYRNMYLTLVNEQTQLQTRYIVTDRQSYFFPGLKNEGEVTYTVALVNRFGTVVSQRSGIKGAPGVTLVQLTDPLPVVTATVVNADNRMTLTWYDRYGDRITSATTLAGLVPGDVVQFDVKLGPVLGVSYAPLPRQTVTIPQDAEGDYAVTLPLQPRTKHTFVGFVRDADTRLPLHEITVTHIQNEEGINYNQTAYSYSDGRFIVSAFDGPLTITLSSKDYLRRDMELFVTPTMPASNQLGDVYLQRANGKVVTLSFTQTEVGIGQPGGTYSLLSATDDVLVKVYNESKGGAELRNISVQYPQVVVLSGADDGDRLRLAFSSASGAFDDFSATAQLNGGRATVQADIVKKGGYQSTFTTTQNGRVAAIVYDSQGRYVRHDLHQQATLSVSGLSAGDYTLVTMAYDPVLSQLTTLQAFNDAGLQRDIDYLQRDFSVSPGVLTVIEQGEVPTLHAEQLKIIHQSTTFSVNQNTVTLGDYITVRTRVKLKNEFVQNSWNYGDFRLLFDIPQGCSYLKGSLMLYNETVDADYEDGRLMVRSSSLEEGQTVDVRFCLVCEKEGPKQVTGMVGYTKYDWTNGDTHYVSPIGGAPFTVIPMEYEIEKQTLGNIIATGNAPKGATVSLYDDTALLGQTTVSGKTWSFNETLPQTHNMSLHPIHIECVTKEGNVYDTPVTNVLVNRDLNTVSRVTMIYSNHISYETYNLTWDFINPDPKEEHYMFEPWSRQFTFLIDFLRNDTTEVDNVKLYVEYSNGYEQPFDAHYNEERGCWVTAIELSELWVYPPVHVAVSFTPKKVKMRVDREQMELAQQDIDAFIAQMNRLNALMADATEENIDQKVEAFEQELGITLTPPPTASMLQWQQWYDGLSTEEAEAEIDRLLAETEQQLADMVDYERNITQQLPLDANGTYTLSDGTTMRVSNASDYSEAALEAQGFERMEATDGSAIYLLSDDHRNVMVDFKTGTAVEITWGAAQARGPRRDLADTLEKIILTVSEVVDRVTQAYDETLKAITSSAEDLKKKMDFLQGTTDKLNKILADPKAGTLKKAACRVMLLKTKLSMTSVTIGMKWMAKMPGWISKIIPVATYVATAVEFTAKCKQLKALDASLPRPCPEDEAGVNAISADIGSTALALLGYTSGKLVLQAACDALAASGIVTSAGTGGVTLAITAAAYIAKVATFWVADKMFDSYIDGKMSGIKAAMKGLKCEKDKPFDPGEMDYSWKPDKYKPQTVKKTVLIDPAGFVCEAVESNRLEGVTATCLYKKEVEDMFGDRHEEVTVWDAENYGQVNPQLTDHDGMYAWMVPAGQWQVRYEKEGYETLTSPWLPVPPPQLDVNVGMVRRAQPTLSDGQAYERAVDLQFSLYMKTRYINAATVTFWQDGQPLSGELTTSNAETAFGQDEENGEAYVSRLRFVPKKALAVGSQVTVHVSGLLRSYADVAIGEDLERTFTVGREVTAIGSEGTITVPYGGSHQVVVSAQSAAAAAYKRVTISSLAPDIARLETSQVTLDAEGKAYITISGRLPGTTFLSYAVEGSQVQGMDTVRVVSQQGYVAAPQASIISGMYVEQGTQVALTAQPGCTIWYTLDGSCPCDASTRQCYSVPITISADTKLRAMAVDAQGNESEVVTFAWFIATAVTPVRVDTPQAATPYDLLGRPAATPHRGIYIRDGRAVYHKGQAD